MSARMVAALAALVAVSVVLAEVLLQPAGDDRAQLLVIIVGPALLAAAVTPLLARWVSSRASVAGVALTVALCSLALGAVSSSAASNAMFVSSHDYRLFLVVLLVSSGIALIVGSQLARPLARDVHRLAQVAADVARGDLTTRTGIDRPDEVGSAARAIDTMVVALAHAEVERARQAAARQHLFTSLGHDLRTPLAAMRAALESIEDGVAADPRQALGVLAAQLRAMDGMLAQLIEYSRLEAGHAVAPTERTSLTELADECLEALGPLAARKGVHLNVRADGPSFVDGRPLDLSRVLRNLVDNAVRHSPEGGHVDITIAAAPGSTRSCLEVCVIDEGPGFPASFRERAFEPFTRADPSRNARTGTTGLGLAICGAIVRAHGGTIDLAGDDRGIVRVLLPTEASNPAEPNGSLTIGASS